MNLGSHTAAFIHSVASVSDSTAKASPPLPSPSALQTRNVSTSERVPLAAGKKKKKKARPIIIIIRANGVTAATRGDGEVEEGEDWQMQWLRSHLLFFHVSFTSNYAYTAPGNRNTASKR